MWMLRSVLRLSASLHKENKMIPKRLFTTSKTKEMRPDLQAYMDTAARLHPDWVFEVVTNPEQDQFVKDHFPQHWDAYQALPHKIMQVDIFRYMKSYVDGGWYLDTDYELFRTLDEFEGFEMVLPICRHTGDKDNPRPHDVYDMCIYASSEKNPFFLFLLDRFFSNPPPANAQIHDVLVYTGPMFFTDTLRAYGVERENWIAPERAKFHPVHKKGTGHVRSEEQYGAHHCAEQWLPADFHSLHRKIERRLKRLFGKSKVFATPAPAPVASVKKDGEGYLG